VRNLLFVSEVAEDAEGVMTHKAKIGDEEIVIVWRNYWAAKREMAKSTFSPQHWAGVIVDLCCGRPSLEEGDFSRGFTIMLLAADKAIPNAGFLQFKEKVDPHVKFMLSDLRRIYVFEGEIKRDDGAWETLLSLVSPFKVA
jgi:hypothetical protein